MVLDPLGYSGRMRGEVECEEEEEVDVESGGGDSLAMLLPQKDDKKHLSSQLQCVKIYLLEPLSRHPKSTPFRKPVDPLALGIPDYPKIITKPMDLGTVREKIRTRKYVHYRDCLKDVDLIWKNAKTFNPQDHFVHQIAIELEEFSKEKVSKIDFANCKYTDLPSNKRRKVSNNTTTNNNNNNNNNNHLNKYSSKPPPPPAKTFPSSHLHQAPNQRRSLLSKPPIEACREILEELVDSSVHSSYAGPFKRLPKGRLDLIKLRNRLRKGIYVHPGQVAEDFRSIIGRTYRAVSREEEEETEPSRRRIQLASQLQHKFEVMFARRVSLDEIESGAHKTDLTDPHVYTQTLLSAQDTLLSIQSNLQHLLTSFYMSKERSRKRVHAAPIPRKRQQPIHKQSSSKKRPLSEPSPSPPKKKAKGLLSEPKWSREDIIDLQTRIGRLDENHQQPILSLMHKNGEKITEDEEGYVVLDIEEASSKSLSDIKDYIDSLPPIEGESSPPPQHPRSNAIKEEGHHSDSSSSDSDDSSSDSSSDDSSDDEDD